MFSTLWILAGTILYGIVNSWIILKLKHDRKLLILFLIFSALIYVPFIGLPLINAAAQREEFRRDSAMVQIAVLKMRLGIADTTTDQPKHDRYLNHHEIERLIQAISKVLPEPKPDETGTDEPISFLCDSLYLYAYLLDHPELSFDQKWRLTTDMPRVFYRPLGATENGPALASDINDPDWREVRRSWTALRAAPEASPRLALCPAPS